jgi:hypothetical protein
MKFKPGCGCLALVLGVVNALISLSVIYGIIQGSINTGVALGMLVVFAGNVAVCFRMGLPAIRAGGRKESDEASEGEGGGEQEGKDESEEGTGEED